MEPGEITNLQIALEPRMMFDGAAVATAAQVAENAADNSDGDAEAAADNGDGKPTVSGTESSGLTASIDSDGNSTFEHDLFSGVSADLEGVDNKVDSLKITVSSSSGGQALVAEGKIINLKDNADAWTGQNGDIHYTVSKNSSGGFDIVFTFEQILTETGDTGKLTPERFASLIDSLQYKITDGKELTDNEVRVRVDSLSYNSGSTVEFGLEAVITIDSEYNNAPELVQGESLSLVEQATMQGYDIAGNIDISDDGTSAVAITNSGDLVRFTLGVDGKISDAVKLDHSALKDLGIVKDVQISGDGRNIYILNQVGQSDWASKTQITHVTYSESSDTLEFKSNKDGFGSKPQGIALSADSRYISVICTNGIYDIPLEKDGSFGTPEGDGRVTAEFYRGPIIASGNLLFQADCDQNVLKLTAFIRGEDGALKQLKTSLLAGFAQFTGTEVRLSVSADSTRLVVLSSVRGENLMAIFNVGSDGTLTKVSASNTPGSNAYRDAALSKDGSTLYLLNSDGTKVEQYKIGADGSLSQSAVIDGLKDCSELAVNAVTGDVYAAGSLISRLSDKLTLNWGKEWHFSESLHDAELDRGEGNYNGASVTITASEAGGKFGFSAEGYGYDEASGNVTKDGETVAVLKASGNTLTIEYKDGATTADADAVLKGACWSASSGSYDTVTFTLKASDGEKESGEVSYDISLEPSKAPENVANESDGVDYKTPEEESAIFSGVSINTGGDKVTEMTVTVSGLTGVGESERLLLDGTEIHLKNSSSGKTQSGISYNYVLDAYGNGRLTITGSFSASAASDILNNARYVNDSRATDGANGLNGRRTFTLIHMKDDGSTEQSGKNEASFNISTDIRLAINDAPTVSVEGDHQSSAILEFQGKLEGANGYVNDIVVSEDGRTVVAISNTGANGNGTSSLQVFVKNSEGKYELVQTFVQGTADDPATSEIETNGITKLSAVKFSGNTLYAAGMHDGAADNAYSILRFAVGEDGRLTSAGVLASQGEALGGATVDGLTGPISEIIVSEDGKSLYTVNGLKVDGTGSSRSALAMFSIGTDGALSFIGRLGSDAEEVGGIYSPVAAEVSADGKFVYVANRASVSVFARGEDGSLTFTKQLSQTDMQALLPDADARQFKDICEAKLSADGKFLYVMTGTTNNGSGLLVLSVDGSELSLVQFFLNSAFINSAQAGGDLELSADGKTLYYSAKYSGVAIYSIDSSGKLSYLGLFADAGWMQNMAVAQDGTLIGGDLFRNTGISVVHTGTSVETAGSELIIGNAIHISDADHNVRGSYNGFSVTIEREGGANPSDAFDVKSGSGYSVAGGKLLLNGQEVATFSSTDGKLEIVFTADLKQADAQAALDAVVLKNGDASKNSNYTVTVADKEGKTASGTLHVMAVDAAIQQPGDKTPEFQNAGTQLFPEITLDIKGEAFPGTITVTSSDKNASYAFKEGSGYSISDAGVLTLNGTEIGSIASENGKITITLNDGATVNQATGALQNLVFTTKNYQSGQSVSFDVDYQGKNGASAQFDDAATVILNAAPVWNGGDLTIIVKHGEAVSYELPANLFTDADKEALTYTVTGLPQGLSFDSATRTISGTLPAGFKTANITITVSDGHQEVSHDVTMEAPNNAPVWNTTLGDNYTMQAEPGGNVSLQLPENLFTDPDGDKLTWSVTGLPAGFSFNAATHVITGTAGKDAADFSFTVTVKDSSGETASHSVGVQFINQPPVWNDSYEGLGFAAKTGENFSISIPDDLFSDTTGDKLTWTAEGLPEGVSFDAGALKLTGKVDTSQDITFKLTVTDAGGNAVSHDFTLKISETPNQAPFVKGDAVKEYSSAYGKPVTGVDLSNLFSDDDNDALSLTVKGLPEGLKFANGKFEGVPNETGTFTLEVQARDGKGGVVKTTVMLTIPNEAPELVKDKTLGDATAGSNYEANFENFFTDPEGQKLSYSIDGSIPAGLTFSDGKLTGTLTTPGEYNFTVTARDPGGLTASKDFTIHVLNTDPVWTEPADHPFTTKMVAGQHFEENLTAYFRDNDGGQKLSFTVTGLPKGITLNAETGLISGTAEEAGTFKLVLTATDPYGGVKEQTIELTVTNEAPTVVENHQSDIGGVTAGKEAIDFDFSTQFQDADPGQSLSYAVSKGSLPPGVTLDAATGKLTGTPSFQGEYAFTITVNDGFGGTASQEFTITVNNHAPALSPDATLPSGNDVVIENGIPETNVKDFFTDADGHEFTVKVEGLPPGIEYDEATGIVKGTPTEAGTYNIVFTVDDGFGGVTEKTLVFIVCGNELPQVNPDFKLPDDINQGGIPEIVIGTEYSVDVSQAFVDKDGDPITMTFEGLPPGMSFNPETMRIEGMPTGEGDYIVKATATDPYSNGKTTDVTFAIHVRMPDHVTPDTPPCVPVLYDPLVGSELPERLRDTEMLSGPLPVLSGKAPSVSAPSLATHRFITDTFADTTAAAYLDRLTEMMEPDPLHSLTAAEERRVEARLPGVATTTLAAEPPVPAAQAAETPDEVSARDAVREEAADASADAASSAASEAGDELLMEALDAAALTAEGKPALTEILLEGALFDSAAGRTAAS